MGDIKIFSLAGGAAKELEGGAVALERQLQSLIERNLATLLGIRFVASEFSTGKRHGGRIDTLGLDENGFPVIIEYKRAVNENVISQGLFYLDWLLDHKGDFFHLVEGVLGREAAETIEWASPRVLLIAGEFTKYDEHAVQQMGRNIELIRYRAFASDLLLLELVNAPQQQIVEHESRTPSGPPTSTTARSTVSDYLERASADLKLLYADVKSHIESLGDDVQVRALNQYIAFRRIQNFACVEIHNQKGTVVVFVKVDPASVEIDPTFMRDVSNVGHFGTGDLELTIRSAGDLERAKPFIQQSYEAS